MQDIPTYQERNEALHQTKLEYNDKKLKKLGSYDFDDHGWIPFDEPIEIEPALDPESGQCTGMDAVSKTFERFLDAHPVYIHPYSAFAGGYAGNLIGLGHWRKEHRMSDQEPLLEKYNITTRGLYGMNHCGPDMNIGLTLGWGGLLEKIRTWSQRNNLEDKSFYEGEERLVLAIQRWIKRHVEYARQQADQTTDPFLRKNYQTIADTNEWLIDNAPRTLREAIQFLCWFQCIDRMYYNGGAMQQLDELLRPYYEADKKAGLIQDDEEVVWYVVSLLFNDTHYHQIGGQHPVDGHDLASPMSFLILEGMHRLKIPANVALRVYDGMNDQLLDKAVQYLFEDGTGVSYSCSKGLNTGFMKNGFPETIARMRAKVGCNWTALPGIEYSLQDVTRVCLAKPMLLALDDMLEQDQEYSMENLWRRYEKHLQVAVDLIKDGIDWHVRYKHLERPEIVLNLFAHGPIERGIDMSCGGVDIYNFACDGTALATVADSLAAIEQRVVKEKKLSWKELQSVLKNNFRDAESVRLMLKNVPHFGSGNSIADVYAKRVADLYTRLMGETPTRDGFRVLPGIFSHGDVYRHGEHLSATPNGRFDGAPISHSADPDPGFLPGGGTAPTAKANAVAKVQSGYGNSTPLQIDLDRSLMYDMGGKELVKAFIRSHNEMGGTLININIVSKEMILEAHANPEKYPDLVVRVTGYSAFFKSLSREYRQQVVDRWIGQGA